MRKPKETFPPPRPKDDFETDEDRLKAYIQFVADTKCTAVELGDYYYEFTGDITLLVEHDKVTAHHLQTEAVVIAKPQPPTDEEWMDAIR